MIISLDPEGYFVYMQ